MATTTSRTLLKEMLHLSSTLPFSFSLRLRALPSLSLSSSHLNLNLQFRRSCPSTPFTPIRCVSSSGPGDGGNKVSSRLSQVHQLLQEAEERALSADTGPTPKITLDHVTVSYARSGGPGGQNVNKVLFGPEQEKNRINKDGELVISSTRTRTQKGNIEDALAKLQICCISKSYPVLITVSLFHGNIFTFAMEIIDAAAYVPPPPSEEQKKKIAKMAAIGEQKRLKSKKVLSDKKAFRRSKNSWD
ncbi:hypothetical protein Ahy_A01g002668 [Arachis hypogaea]|uniref:Prokaryotic-type class I peptide chain release factors domain-containing protein n=1 Tax=Arachis hypogaea TaxID=3818 RepID=A0A445ER40_ARAHY|nr:hypothetical protein Ahy_A01g002668 [Arachis hypogaea]